MLKNFLKLSIIVISLFFYLGEGGYASDWLAPITGTFECKVRAVSTQKLEEGTYKIVSGYKGGALKVGDTFKIEYSYSVSGRANNLLQKICIDTRPKYLFNPLCNFMKNTPAKITEHGIVIGQNGMKLIDNANYNNLTLHRYYKDDWSGFYNETHILSGDFTVYSESVALNCRNKKDSIDEIVSKIRLWSEVGTKIKELSESDNK